MIISRITKQKHGNRFNIFVKDRSTNSETFAFGVDEDLLVKFQLYKGMEINGSFIQMIKQQDAVHQTYLQVINYLGYRMRSKFEIEQYLERKEVDASHIIEIIHRLEKEGLIDDIEFAKAFVRQRINQSRKGPKLVKEELIATKGISENIAEVAVQQYTFEIQYEQAMKIVRQRAQRTERDSLQRRIQKLQGALTRNGFTADVIQEVIDEARELFIDYHNESDALLRHGERLLRRHQKNLSGFELKQKITEGLYRQGFSFERINEFLDEQNIAE